MNDSKDTHATVPLIALLKDADVDIRQAVADALGEINDPRAFESLLFIFKNDTNQNVRHSAENALIKILNSHIDVAIGAVKLNEPNIRLKAISILVGKGHPVVRQPEIIDWLVSSSANLLNDNGGWSNFEDARKFYNTLKGVDSRLVIDSLVRHIFKPKLRLRALFLGVKLGIPGSPEILVDVLMKKGDKSMAEDFLNSGSQELHEGGERWASYHGYSLLTGAGSHRATWGEF